VETIGSKRSYALTWCTPNNDDDDDDYIIIILLDIYDIHTAGLLLLTTLTSVARKMGAEERSTVASWDMSPWDVHTSILSV